MNNRSEKLLGMMPVGQRQASVWSRCYDFGPDISMPFLSVGACSPRLKGEQLDPFHNDITGNDRAPARTWCSRDQSRHIWRWLHQRRKANNPPASQRAYPPSSGTQRYRPATGSVSSAAYLNAGITSWVRMRRLFLTWASVSIPPALSSAMTPSMPNTSLHSLKRSMRLCDDPKATRLFRISS